MDPISQGVVGGIVAQSFSDKKNTRIAGICGFIAGLPADLDILIRSATNPLLTLEYHRHFTHSLAFVPFGALIVSSVLYLFVRKRLTFRQLYGICFLGYGTSGLLDACTSYGTRLFWPFSDQRVAWDNIGIVDPLFTLTLLICLLVVIVRKNRVIARFAFLFGLTYLFIGVVQRERAKNQLLEIAESRGHQIVRYTVKPTVMNLWVWRGIYHTKDRYYVDAYHVGFKTRVYSGDSVKLLTEEELLRLVPPDSLQAKDIKRFAHFSDNYLYWVKDEKMVIGDLRYALLPHQVAPLWGIQLTPESPNAHVSFGSYRRMEEDTWSVFGAMLTGKDLP